MLILPILPNHHHLNEPIPPWLHKHLSQEPTLNTQYQQVIDFLKLYVQSDDTFKAYRRDLERLCQWAWFVQKTSLLHLTVQDMHAFFTFVATPPTSWISTHHHPRFLTTATAWKANPKWRPFVHKPSKTQRRCHMPPTKMILKPNTKRAMLAILGSFFSYLVQTQQRQTNPVAQMRQKKQLLQSQQKHRISRKLTNEQWQHIIETTLKQAQKNTRYQRNLFVMSLFYLLGLRISEISSTPKRMPKMGDFAPDHHGLYWFHTIGKGNKYREVAVPDAMLNALKTYRTSLHLPALPLREEPTPLLPKLKGQGGLGTRQVRNLVQQCFDWAIASLQEAQCTDAALDLNAATVHWLRHTALSQDVKHRPREHVRDDAGHENSSITDLYIETDRLERHQSAQAKPLIPTPPIQIITNKQEET
jgi:site-specific recombinase XerD